MAMMAAAPTNGWGMIGTAPTAIQIVSVRILEPGQTTFPFAYYTAAINVCLELQSEYNIKVINLSLGTTQTPTSEDYTAIRSTIARANDYGVDVVAAAGNDTGGPLDYPAALPAVLSVGATDALSGAFCSFSNRGSGLRLLAPGCDLDAADPTSGVADENYWQGTSEASVIAAAALAALRAYQPTLTPQAAESDLTSADNGTLDIAQTFENAGLSNIVDAGSAAEPAAPSSSQSTAPPASPDTATPGGTPSVATGPSQPGGDPLKPLPKPTVTLSERDRRLTATLTNRLAYATAQLRLLGYRAGSRRLALIRTLQTSSRSVTFEPDGATELQVRYRDSYDLQRTSAWTTSRIPAPKGRGVK